MQSNAANTLDYFLGSLETVQDYILLHVCTFDPGS